MIGMKKIFGFSFVLLVLSLAIATSFAADKALIFPFSSSQGQWGSPDWNKITGPDCLYIQYVDYAEIKVCCPQNYTMIFYPIDRKYQQVASMTFENSDKMVEVDMKIYRPGVAPAVEKAPAGEITYKGQKIAVYKNVIGQNVSYINLDTVSAVVVCQFINQSLVEEILENMQVTPPDMQKFMKEVAGGIKI